jgi:hypothetical protein
VLPLLAGHGSFFSDAEAAFGGVFALPGTVSASTMEQVAMHLHEHTDDGSIEGLRELVQQATGEPEPTIKNIVNALLKFQGIKVSASGAGTAHSHGRLSQCGTGRPDGVHRPRARYSLGVPEACGHGPDCSGD